MTENGVVSQPDADVAASLEDAPAHPVARRELPEPRVHLATASWSFEEAALDILRQVAVGRKKSGEVYELLHDLERVIGLTHDRRKKSGEVCELLLCGIHHDLVFKQRINKDGHPSFRLYDLLAGVSIRYEQKTYLEQLLKLIKDSKQQHIFQTRIQKWQDVTSPWRQRWRNRKEPITWKSNSGAVVF
jgi:hypothetical protein